MPDRRKTKEELVWSPQTMVDAINKHLYGVVDILEHIVSTEEDGELKAAAEEARARFFDFERAWQRFAAVVRRKSDAG